MREGAAARIIILTKEAGHAFLAIVLSQFHLQEPIFKGQESKRGIDWKDDGKIGGEGKIQKDGEMVDRENE